MDFEHTLEPAWRTALKNTFEQPFFIDLKLFLIDEYEKNLVYPPKSELFAAFNKTPFNKVKVVILGQDPYHGVNQAHGLSFSVRSKKYPPSLRNIFKELKNDLGVDIPTSGDLSKWAEEGVLLLNTTLSVSANKPLSHQKKGWEKFTDVAISTLSYKREGIIFLLWGGHAQSKENLIDTQKHVVLKAPHPSPLSAYRGFIGCKHFSKTNKLLISKGKSPIDWVIN
ncbi:MAG: uracil-DNA glycosylase [Vicingaceae bacterium]